MADGQEADAFTSKELEDLEKWRQGDFALDCRVFPVITDWSKEDLDQDLHAVEGWVVISQTCDIVNVGPGKEFVTVCPIVVATPGLKAEVDKGMTPAAAGLELPVDDMHVVDLGRSASLHKKALLQLDRHDGFKTDFTRSIFSESLERRFGRFAFPTLISNGPLRHLRNRAKEKHDVNSEAGQVYRAISQFRLRAAPNFDTKGALVAFHVVVDPEKIKAVGRRAVLDELKKVADHPKFAWPDEDFGREEDFFVVQTLDEMSGREYQESWAVDLDFLSKG
ncbi:hypothetical protein Rhsp01_34280 [Rhizobium sp. NBRC 114257]|uniref:Uncharacterized protein n=1 Tax=Rhizobium dioscoreae TaxID=2653122 RepID=A0ABQ0Z3K6_9HYPH|nr:MULTISPECIES: hypothetical protein [Rhizobium]GES49988.1 hypothetical protein RsS93_26020 [Rhizobium dioscoreae]GLU82252.1 hypothetical protein Rhsp01_34280 [Rhizobium sp. NBRC 114257]